MSWNIFCRHLNAYSFNPLLNSFQSLDTEFTPLCTTLPPNFVLRQKGEVKRRKYDTVTMNFLYLISLVRWLEGKSGTSNQMSSKLWKVLYVIFWIFHHFNIFCGFVYHVTTLAPQRPFPFMFFFSIVPCTYLSTIHTLCFIFSPLPRFIFFEFDYCGCYLILLCARWLIHANNV